MRALRFLLLGAGLSGLLAACGDSTPSPRLDLVGASNLRTSSGLVGPGDTLRTRALADTPDAAAPLSRVTITVQYGDQPPLTYFDTTLVGVLRYAREIRYNASTESGRETWRFSTTDAAGREALRSYRLTVRQPDSAAAYHSYAVRLQPPRRARYASALALVRGLALPPYATRQPAYQQLTDLLYLPDAAGNLTLAAPADTAAARAAVLGVGAWLTRRATGLALSPLTREQFAAISTAAAISAAVANAGPRTSRTPPLQEGQVFAFRTGDNRDGLLLVSDTTTRRAELLLNVKIRR